MAESIFASGLGPGPANFSPLTPLRFLARSAAIYPDRTAIIHGARRINYREFDARARRLASALAERGIGEGDTVAVILPNVPAMLEVHQGVPALGAVLNAINTRLDARTIAYILAHGEAKALITDLEFSPTVREALARLDRKPLVVDLDDPLYEGPGDRLGNIEYEAFLAQGSPTFEAAPIRDEWKPIALNYTSGTTGNPKGVVFHHRGTWVMTIGQILSWHIPPGAVYLWTLPIFHANGWCFPWAINAMAGTHVCLRRVDPALTFRLIAEHRVTNLVGAPTVLNMLVNAPAEARRRSARQDPPCHERAGLPCAAHLWPHRGPGTIHPLRLAGRLGDAGAGGTGGQAGATGRALSRRRLADGRRPEAARARSRRRQDRRRDHAARQHGDAGLPEG